MSEKVAYLVGTELLHANDIRCREIDTVEVLGEPFDDGRRVHR